MGQAAASPVDGGLQGPEVGKGGCANWEAGSGGCLRVAMASLGSASQFPKTGSCLQAGGGHSKAFPGRPRCPEQAAVTTVFSQTLVETPFNVSPGRQNCIMFTKGTSGFWELFMKILKSQRCQMIQQSPGAAPWQSSFGDDKAGGSERAGQGDMYGWAADSPERGPQQVQDLSGQETPTDTLLSLNP